MLQLIQDALEGSGYDDWQDLNISHESLSRRLTQRRSYVREGLGAKIQSTAVDQSKVDILGENPDEVSYLQTKKGTGISF